MSIKNVINICNTNINNIFYRTKQIVRKVKNDQELNLSNSEFPLTTSEWISKSVSESISKKLDKEFEILYESIDKAPKSTDEATFKTILEIIYNDKNLSDSSDKI